MVAEYLDKPDLCRLRLTMSREVVSKTINVFAKKTFGDSQWQSKLLSQSTLEQLEEIVECAAFIPYVTALEFKLCNLQTLRAWIIAISMVKDPRPTPSRIAKADWSLYQLQTLARNEEKFWGTAESWARLSHVFRKLKALDQITTLGAHEKLTSSSSLERPRIHPDFRKLQERFALSLEAPFNHSAHKSACLKDLGFRLLVAIARSGLQLKHLGTPTVTIHNVTFLDQLVRFEWMEQGKPSKAPELAIALNRWFSFMPRLQDLRITGNSSNDDCDLNLTEVRWPKTLMKLTLQYMMIFQDQLKSFHSLPFGMTSLQLRDIRICRREQDDALAWFDELENSLKPRELFLSFEWLRISHRACYLVFPCLSASDVHMGVRRLGHQDDDVGCGESIVEQT